MGPLRAFTAALALTSACASTVVATDAGLDPSRVDAATTDDVPGATASAPKLLRPMSATRTTRGAPTLRWAMPPGATRARVLVCADRACAAVVRDVTVTDDHFTFASALRPVVHFWRVEVNGRASATWSFWPSPRGAAFDASFGQVADFNRDGLADLALVRARAVEVYLGRATGYGGVPDQIVRARADGYCAVASGGDLDGDGFVDLVAHRCAPDGAARPWERLRGVATGLASGGDLAVADDGKVVGVGDLDGDGLGDLAVAAGVASEAGWLRLVLGSGRVVEVSAPPGAPPLSRALPAAVWDVDVDGRDDVGVGVYGTSDAAWVLRAAASDAPQWSRLGGAPELPWRGVIVRTLAAGDVNGDGASDVVVSRTLYDNDARRYELYDEVHNGARRGPAPSPSQLLLGPLPGDAPPRSLLVTDLDEDGIWDAIVSGATTVSGTTTAWLRYNLGTPAGLTATWQPFSAEVVVGDANPRFAVGTADLRGNGTRDLAVLGPDVAGASTQALRVFWGFSSGITPPRVWGGVAPMPSWFEPTVVCSR